MYYNLKNMNMLAYGGQAEIYEIDERKVLRVMKNPADEQLLKNEFEIMKTLRASGVSVPEVYEYLIADERPALVVERINGSSMMDIMKRKPLGIFKQLKIFARMHRGILEADAIEGLFDSRQSAKYLTEKSPLLCPDAKSFIISLIGQLPEGSKICHGDFHPGNILFERDRYYIIVWFGAAKGSGLSDIAHTYLLFKNTPEVPGISRLQNTLLRISGGLLAGRYFNIMDKEMHIPRDEFSKWLAVKAAERTYYGMPSEKKRLVQFIERCGKNPGKEKVWYKYL